MLTIFQTSPLTRRRDNITPRRAGEVPQQLYWVIHLGLPRDVIETTNRGL